MKLTWASLLLFILGFNAVPCLAAASDSWNGRKLSSVLSELRAAGLPLVYSTQIVSDELVIRRDPGLMPQLTRLQQVLQDFDLALQALEPASQGYAIVRAQVNKPAAAVAAEPESLQEVTVFASLYNLSRDEHRLSRYLPRASLEKAAGIEQDVLRSVQYLPGATGNSLSTLTHVRGGYEDENLVRFDGVELYNPVHLKDFQGLFGMLDPDWAQSLNFYSGAFPVQYGNHASAVIDIAPRTTSARELTLGGSLLYSRLLSTGSYDDDAGHWLLGYRRSNLPNVLRQSERDFGEPEFEDLLLRHSFRFDRGELRIGSLLLNDDLDLQTNNRSATANVSNHDNYAWVGWQQDWSEAVNYSLQISHSNLSNRRHASLQRDLISNGIVDDQRDAQLNTLDSQITWQNSQTTQLQAGLHYNLSQARYRYLATANYLAPLASTFGQPNSLQRNYSQDFREPDYVSYISVNHQQGAWHTELGLRYDAFPYLDNGRQFSPRLNVQYAFSSYQSLQFSAGQYLQAQTLNMLDSSAATPRFYAPQRMQQYILGWTQALAARLQLRIEGYYKYGSQPAPHNESLLSFITLASDLEVDRNTVVATHSRADGIEVSLTSPAQNQLGWWLNYSASRVQDELNGHYVRRSWDQPQSMTAAVNWTRGRWLLAGSGTWHTGWAYTPVILGSDASSATLGSRNSQRFNDFASLELRAQYTAAIRTAHLQLFVELRNALDRGNECCRDVSVVSNNGVPLISISDQVGLHLIPIAGFNLKF
jgi:hypothetical protein